MSVSTFLARLFGFHNETISIPPKLYKKCGRQFVLMERSRFKVFKSIFSSSYPN